ncbi:GNAT family N-acetyltransferase [Ureibacillus sp. MALMAid1270]|uniref:GNAT family N-acetyltransferase n=1 Tax=Ureibacillus sp. MALMAid1270 TaxID=3411629 RepID=UPI003BA63CBF
MDIIEATMQDIEDLTILMEHLGYPTTIDNMKIRFSNIFSKSDYKTLIALIDDRVVGMIGLIKCLSYEMDGCYVRIGALVVHSDYQNKGIGKRLIEEAENFARSIGASGIVLNSGNRPERMKAHQFYKNQGYSDKSTGFVKKLD